MSRDLRCNNHNLSLGSADAASTWSNVSCDSKIVEKTYLNDDIGVVFVGIGSSDREPLRIDPFTGGGKLSYRQSKPYMGTSGEVYLTLRSRSFPFQGLHWVVGSAHWSGFARNAIFTLGFHARAPTVTNVSPSSGKPGGWILLSLSEFPNVLPGETAWRERPFSEYLYAVQFGMQSISSIELNVIQRMDGKASVSFVIPDLGISSPQVTNVDISVWSPLSCALATASFAYIPPGVPVPDNALNLSMQNGQGNASISNSSELRPYLNSSEPSNMTSDQHNSSVSGANVSMMMPLQQSCDENAFCSARGQVAKSVVPGGFNLCDELIHCIAPSDIVNLALAPEGTSPNYVVAGETIMTALFVNCFATGLGQLRLTVGPTCNEQTFDTELIDIQSLPSSEYTTSRIPVRPQQCKITFQAPAIPCFSTCIQAQFHLTVRLSDTVQQQVDFQISYVQPSSNPFEIKSLSPFYSSAENLIKFKLLKAATYADLQSINLQVAEYSLDNARFIEGDCREVYVSAFMSAEKFSLATEAREPSLNISVVLVYENSLDGGSQFTSELISSFTTVSGPVISAKDPTVLRADLGGCMIVTVYYLPFISFVFV